MLVRKLCKWRAEWTLALVFSCDRCWWWPMYWSWCISLGRWMQLFCRIERKEISPRALLEAAFNLRILSGCLSDWIVPVLQEHRHDFLGLIFSVHIPQIFLLQRIAVAFPCQWIEPGEKEPRQKGRTFFRAWILSINTIISLVTSASESGLTLDLGYFVSNGLRSAKQFKNQTTIDVAKKMT